MHNQIQLGPQGRIVIPAEIRQELGLAPGSVLQAQVVDGKLVLEPPTRVINQFYARFAKSRYRLKSDASPVDALLQERREQAAQESQGHI
jgi:AbrB family looped-hinge helix DNA binding protein